MSQFSVYFQLGLEHILDLNGYDHMLFIIALCAVFSLSDWSRILILVTAFTIGHSITLALSTLDIIVINSDIIEFAIPLTIFITAFSNIYRRERPIRLRPIRINYFYAAFFGLIHGLGFSNYLKALLGKKSDIVVQLLAFNLGLELGQLIVVLVFLTISSIMINLFNVYRRDWMLIISSGVAGIALMLVFAARFW